MRRQQRQAGFEPLEVRRCFDVAWQNPINHLDVDATELVDLQDLQKITDLIKESGVRQLSSTKPANELFCDVNGDGYMTAIDVLAVVNVLNKYSSALSISPKVAIEDDLDQNGVVLSSSVTYLGQTLPDVSVAVYDATSASSNTNPLQIVTSNQAGEFTFATTLNAGVNAFRFEAIDPRGRTASKLHTLRLGDAVTNWNATALQVVRDWTTTSNDPFEGRVVNSQPPMVARNLAMIHTAFFDAMNAVERKYESYLQLPSVPSNIPSVAAGVAAAHRVASTLYSSQAEQSRWDKTLTEILAAIEDSPAKASALSFGKSVGDAMLEDRANDGSKEVVVYTPVDQPGHWDRTAPGYLPPLLPQWPGVDTFTITSASDYRVAAPPALTSEQYAAAVDEVMRLGSKTNSQRTTDQTAIAVFWADGAGTATPPGHWNQIAADVVMKLEQDSLDNARIFALLNMAMADAAIVSWDAKFHYDLWRPIDAIRQADSDGNTATTADSNWTPLLVTPPFPTYTSGHSTFSGAAASALTQLLGEVSFTAYVDPVAAGGSGLIEPHLIASRSFESFADAANEAGASRIYGGIHFNFDNQAGLAAGNSIGTYAVSNYLKQLT